jgi:hypothetical protein
MSFNDAGAISPRSGVHLSPVKKKPRQIMFALRQFGRVITNGFQVRSRPVFSCFFPALYLSSSAPFHTDF